MADAAAKYRPFQRLHLPDRTWPDQGISTAPRWCAVDLRDGNQALVNPMRPEQKERLLRALLDVGFSEIEMGFPSASVDDFEFLRRVIDAGLAPAATLQVLVQAREELMERTYSSLVGAERAVVHFYNSTSVAQRRDVFTTDVAGITALAVAGAEMVLRWRDRFAGQIGEVDFEYSPESFTGTEPDVALEVVSAVLDTLLAHTDSPVIVNLPATVEMHGPHVFADSVEWMHRNLPHRARVVLSIHPHNDRGSAVAAAELALAAGADRLEGTVFGNGERTGNLDLVTVALNLLTHGVDPGLDLSDLPRLRREYEASTGMAVHPRHPYAGDLVFTAFSGSHQDAIRKGLRARNTRRETVWDVPYLPIDPADIGRRYEPVIRLNSQSGKGGAAFVLESELGIEVPRGLAQALAPLVQESAERSGREVSALEVVELYTKHFERPEVSVRTAEVATGAPTRLAARLAVAGAEIGLHGAGTGPLDALAAALATHLGHPVEILEYVETALTAGSDASAACFIAVRTNTGTRWGAARGRDTLLTALTALARATLPGS
jgi:2-isopropylmalate synthase